VNSDKRINIFTKESTTPPGSRSQNGKDLSCGSISPIISISDNNFQSKKKNIFGKPRKYSLIKSTGNSGINVPIEIDPSSRDLFFNKIVVGNPE